MSDFIITPIAMSLKVQEEGEMRSTLSVKPVVVSTDKSYAKVDPQSSEIGKEEGDISGPFDLVIQATDTYKDNSSKVVMLASPYLLMDDWIDYYSCVNAELFIDCLDWMNDSTVASITIPQRSLDAVYLEVGMNEATLWAVITVIIIPLCILAIGFVVWYFRRKH